MRRPEARDYAARLHGGLTRKGAAREPAAREPFVDHGIDKADRVARIGADAAALMPGVTDNTSPPKLERKRLQEATVAGKSVPGRRIKLADKAWGVTALAESPPVHWVATRRTQYVVCAERVIAGCRGIDPVPEAAFDAAAARAKAVLGKEA